MTVVNEQKQLEKMKANSQAQSGSHVGFFNNPKKFTTVNFLMGFSVGILLSLIFDPVAGRARRAKLRDKSVSLGHDLQWQAGRKARDLGHRAQGVGVRIKNQVLRDDFPDNPTIVARVRSALGHHVSHARSVSVDADNGKVILTGPVLRDEVEELISTVKSVRGVKEISNQLRVFDSKDGVPGLQP